MSKVSSNVSSKGRESNPGQPIRHIYHGDVVPTSLSPNTLHILAWVSQTYGTGKPANCTTQIEDSSPEDAGCSPSCK